MSGKSSIIVEYDGQVHTLKEWTKITGFKYVTLCNRYAKGYRGEKLFAKDITINCKICGKEFYSQSSRRKCCSDECALENRRETARQHQRTLREIERNAKREKAKKLTVTDVAVKAKETGMSYGQYVAKMMI